MSQDIYEVYRAQGDSGCDARSATAYLTDQSAASGGGLDAAVNTKVSLKGRTTIFVQCRMSNAAATVAVTCILHNKTPVVCGVAAPGTQTATATSYRDAVGSGDYWTQILIFDAGSADSYEVRHAAPSAGSVDVYTWVA